MPEPRKMLSDGVHINLMFFFVCVFFCIFSLYFFHAPPPPPSGSAHVKGLRINYVICHISGVYLISRSGPVQTSFFWPWLAAMSLFPVTYIFPDKRQITIILTTAVGAYFSMDCAKWDEDVTEEDGYQYSMKRLMVVFLALILHGSLWSSFLYFNVTVMSMNGTMVSIFNAKLSSVHL